jgi:uncharacterized protein
MHLENDTDSSPQDMIFPALGYVADTGTEKGRGVFAARHFEEGDLVESSPVLVLYVSFDSLPPKIRRVVFNWGSLIKGPKSTALSLGYGSLYNHNNPANLRFEANASKNVINYYAAHVIAKGEELTINYNSANGSNVSQRDDWFERHGIVPIVDT